MPAEWRAKIMHARLVIGDEVLMGSDAPPGHQERMAGFSVSLNIDSVAEAERIFHALAEGGTVRMPIGEPSGPRVSGCSSTASARPGW